MNQRYSVRKHPTRKGGFCIWDRMLDCMTNSHQYSHKPSMLNICMHMNRNAKKEATA